MRVCKQWTIIKMNKREKSKEIKYSTNKTNYIVYKCTYRIQ